MPYERKISRKNPGCILFCPDNSSSMQSLLDGTNDPRCMWTERYVGLFLQELLSRSSELSGDDLVVKARYYLSIIMYGSHPVRWGDP